MFIRTSRFHDQLGCLRIRCARQSLADQSPDQRALDMKSESVSAFIELVSAIRGFVAPLRVLRRRGRVSAY